MIIEMLLNLVKTILFAILSIFNLPSLPSDLLDSLDTFLDLIFDNLSLIGLFIRPTTFKIIVPVALVLMNFEVIYKVSMWILRKIPFLNIK